MTWHLNNAPAPRDPSSGWLIINDVQYPPDWPHDDLIALGLEWVEPEPPAPTAEDICRQIDAERDRRINGGFSFGDARFQSAASDRENIMGAATLAMAYLAAGGDPDDLRWADPDKDFGWIIEDNSTMPMTAPMTVALFQAGVAFKAALTFHARDTKDAVLAAADPTSVDWMTGWAGDV